MTIGVYTFEIHIPDAQSLKQKRQVVRRLKDRLRARFNIAIIELNENHSLWQRGGMALVSIADRREILERLFESVYEETEKMLPGTIIEHGTDFLDASDAGPHGWTGDGS